MLQICLSKKDYDFLQEIVNIFNYNFSKQYELKYDQKTKSYKFSFLLCEPIQRLINLGIHPNKTYENDDFIFLNVPDEFKKHFIRGYFDGDGSIFISKNQTRVGFVSLNNKLLQSVLNYIHTIGFKGTINQDKKYTRLHLSGNRSCKQFLDWIYKNATIYMKRKYEIYIKMPNSYLNHFKYTGILYHNNKYEVSISYNNSSQYIGRFLTVKDAVDAYNTIAIQVGKQTQEYNGEELYYE